MAAETIRKGSIGVSKESPTSRSPSYCSMANSLLEDAKRPSIFQQSVNDAMELIDARINVALNSWDTKNELTSDEPQCDFPGGFGFFLNDKNMAECEELYHPDMVLGRMYETIMETNDPSIQDQLLSFMDDYKNKMEIKERMKRESSENLAEVLRWMIKDCSWLSKVESLHMNSGVAAGEEIYENCVDTHTKLTQLRRLQRRLFPEASTILKTSELPENEHFASSSAAAENLVKTLEAIQENDAGTDEFDDLKEEITEFISVVDRHSEDVSNRKKKLEKVQMDIEEMKERLKEQKEQSELTIKNIHRLQAELDAVEGMDLEKCKDNYLSIVPASSPKTASVQTEDEFDESMFTFKANVMMEGENSNRKKLPLKLKPRKSKPEVRPVWNAGTTVSKPAIPYMTMSGSGSGSRSKLGGRSQGSMHRGLDQKKGQTPSKKPSDTSSSTSKPAAKRKASLTSGNTSITSPEKTEIAPLIKTESPTGMPNTDHSTKGRKYAVKNRGKPSTVFPSSPTSSGSFRKGDSDSKFNMSRPDYCLSESRSSLDLDLPRPSLPLAPMMQLAAPLTSDYPKIALEKFKEAHKHRFNGESFGACVEGLDTNEVLTRKVKHSEGSSVSLLGKAGSGAGLGVEAEFPREVVHDFLRLALRQAGELLKRLGSLRSAAEESVGQLGDKRRAVEGAGGRLAWLAALLQENHARLPKLDCDDVTVVSLTGPGDHRCNFCGCQDGCGEKEVRADLLTTNGLDLNWHTDYQRALDTVLDAYSESVALLDRARRKATRVTHRLALTLGRADDGEGEDNEDEEADEDEEERDKPEDVETSRKLDKVHRATLDLLTARVARMNITYDSPRFQIKTAEHAALLLDGLTRELTAATTRAQRRQAGVKRQNGLLDDAWHLTLQVRRKLENAALNTARVRAGEEFLHAALVLRGCVCPYCVCYNSPFARGWEKGVEEGVEKGMVEGPESDREEGEEEGGEEGGWSPEQRSAVRAIATQLTALLRLVRMSTDSQDAPLVTAVEPGVLELLDASQVGLNSVLSRLDPDHGLQDSSGSKDVS